MALLRELQASRYRQWAHSSGRCAELVAVTAAWERAGAGKLRCAAHRVQLTLGFIIFCAHQGDL